MNLPVESTARELMDPSTYAGALIWGIIFIFIAWLTGRLLSLTVRRILNRPKHIPPDPTAIYFLGQLARLGVYLFAFVSYAHLVPAMRSLGTAWLASVGVVSVVLGIAAQNTLGNLISGISLLLYRPFSLGDWVVVAAPTGLEAGVVESLNLGYTILRTPDHRRVVIPNSVMASQVSVNFSMASGRLMCIVPFTLGYEADLERAREILVELAKLHPKTMEYADCPVTSLGNSVAVLSLKVWCSDPQAMNDLKYELWESGKKQLQAAGIQLH